MKRLSAILVVLFLAVSLNAGEILRPRTRACPLAGIPAYDWYIHGASAKTEARSTQGVLLERLAVPGIKPDPALPKIRYFQLDRAALSVDQCTISRVAFYIDSDGNWKLTLRAEQNSPERRKVEKILPGVTAKKEEVYTDYIKRNQFFVRVRGLGANPLPVKIVEAAPAAPVFFQLRPPGFWVERAEPFHYEVFGRWEDVRRYFTAVDRIEVEFWYRPTP